MHCTLEVIYARRDCPEQWTCWGVVCLTPILPLTSTLCTTRHCSAPTLSISSMYWSLYICNGTCVLDARHILHTFIFLTVGDTLYSGGLYMQWWFICRFMCRGRLWSTLNGIMDALNLDSTVGIIFSDHNPSPRSHRIKICLRGSEPTCIQPEAFSSILRQNIKNLWESRKVETEHEKWNWGWDDLVPFARQAVAGEGWFIYNRTIIVMCPIVQSFALAELCRATVATFGNPWMNQATPSPYHL